MVFVTFTEAEKVKNCLMDEQHKQMTHIINKIYTAFILKKNRTLQSQLRILVGHLRSHFDYEETLMQQTQFEGYYSHKLEHDRFYCKVEGIWQSYVDKNPKLTLEELYNVKSWFFNHIEINDKKCGEHFAKNGIS
ncbi:MAG: hemerythrin [Ignavibacteria bacterium]|nr:MAG: hemerythrin [Ignavibacteria bacterium]KAF0161729.1 MAG: hemerythrin [Ignavibacteria bacterium]